MTLEEQLTDRLVPMLILAKASEYAQKMPQSQTTLGHRQEETKNTYSDMTVKHTIKIKQPALSSSAKLFEK